MPLSQEDRRPVAGVAPAACEAAVPGPRWRKAWPATVFGYHAPVFAMESQGSAGGLAAPFWSISIEMLSGERTNAIRPSRGGRFMVTPAFINRSQKA